MNLDYAVDPEFTEQNPFNNAEVCEGTKAVVRKLVADMDTRIVILQQFSNFHRGIGAFADKTCKAAAKSMNALDRYGHESSRTSCERDVN